MLPSMVSYNTGSQMDEDDLDELGAAELADEISDEISEASFEFNASELLSAPIFYNSDDELERDLSQMEGSNQSDGFPAGFDQGAPQGGDGGQTMFLDANGFPVAPPKQVKSKRRPIPEDQRPRRIPGLVKQGSSKSNLLSRSSRATRSLQADAAPNAGMAGFQGNNAFDANNNNNMDMPMDNFNNNMDVNMNTSPHDMDVTMSSPEPETLQVPGNDLRSYNDAMEKLCESMKRSAMSRNIVKELSNRSLPKDGSSRSIGSGTHSTHPSSSRQSSARSINVVSRNSSARSLVQQGSVRSLDGNGFGPLSPGAYVAAPPSSSSSRHHHHHRQHAMEAKHRAAARNGAPNSRGVFRHHSSSAVHNKNSRRGGAANMNQYDDSTLGLVFDGKNMYS